MAINIYFMFRKIKMLIIHSIGGAKIYLLLERCRVIFILYSKDSAAKYKIKFIHSIDGIFINYSKDGT